MITDQQRAYNRVLRQAEVERARVDAMSEFGEREAAEVGKRGGSEGIERARAHRLRRVAALEDAEADLHRAGDVCVVQLGRPLTRHESEAGFGLTKDGALGSHRWWVTNPRVPCVECEVGEDEEIGAREEAETS